MTTTPTPDGVDLDRLGPWFASRVPTYSGAPLTATLIAGGRSNLTYVVTDGTTEWVLRRPPLGHVLPTAHDMAREARVLGALADTAVPVPVVVGMGASSHVPPRRPQPETQHTLPLLGR